MKEFGVIYEEIYLTNPLEKVLLTSSSSVDTFPVLVVVGHTSLC